MRTKSQTATFCLYDKALQALAALFMAGSALAQGQVLEYEGFDYTGAGLNAQNGGTGWNGHAWSDTDLDTPVATNGSSLSFPLPVSFAPAGSRIAFTAAGEAYRTLGTTMALNVESNYYFSALVKRQGPFRFEFRDSGGTYIRWRMGGTNASDAVLGVTTDDVVSGIFPTNETVFLVARMATHTNTAPGDQVCLNIYRAGQSVPLTEPTNWQGSASGNSGVVLTNLYLYNLKSAPLDIDEIRIGTSYASVAGPYTDIAPVITGQPAGLSIYEGLNAQFQATAVGRTPLFYQWQKDGLPIAGATNAALLLTAVQAAQSGAYAVTVTNALGTATSAPALLTVIPVTNITVGLQALWHFDETNGLTARDATANHNDGTLLLYAGDDSQWVPGRTGGALAFDSAASNSVTVPDSPSLGAGLVNRFSVSAWFRSSVPLSATGGTGRVLEKGDTIFFAQGDGKTSGTGGMNFTVKRANVVYAASIGQALESNRWYHIAGTFDGALLRVYLDGEPKGTCPVPGPIDDDHLALRIGSDDSGKYFSGLIDEVGFWDRPLSGSEVLGLSGQSGLPVIEVHQPLDTALADGASTVDFGMLIPGGSGTAKSFTLINRGTANLWGLSVIKDGPDSARFTVDTTGMIGTVAPGASTSFKVTFNPTAYGVCAAALHVASNDPTRNPFDIALAGEGRTSVAVSFNSPSDTGPSTKGINAAGLNLNVTLGFAPATGTQLTAVNNTSPDPVVGFFPNAPDGGTIPVTFGGQTFFFLVRYDGGDGNDVVLQAVDWGHLNSGGCGFLYFVKRDLRVANATRLYIGSDVAGVWRSKNAGTSWEPLTPWRMLDTQDWIADPTDTQGFFVASQTGVWRVSSEGHSWSPYGAFPTKYVSALGAAVDPATGNLVLYAGVGSAWNKNIPSGATAGLYKRIGESAWSPLTVTASSVTLANAVVGLEVNQATPDQLWICGPQGVFYSQDGGSAWELRNSGLPAGNVNRILVNPENFAADAICVVQGNGVFRWSGGIWYDLCGTGGPNPLPTAKPWQSLAWDSSFPFGERLLVLADMSTNNACYYTQNGNTNTPAWFSRNLRGTQTLDLPPGAAPNGAVLYSNAGFIACSVSLKMSDLTLGSSYLWREMYSQSNGVNLLNQSLWSERGFQNTVVGAIAASPADPNRILVGSFDIGLWLSTDGGVRWAKKRSNVTSNTIIRSAVSVAFNPLQPTEVYYGGKDNYASIQGNAAIYFSSNSGDTWTNVSSATFPGYDNSPRDLAFAPDGTLFVAADPDSGSGRGGVWLRITAPDPDWICIGLVGKGCSSLSLAPLASDRMLVGTGDEASHGVWYGRCQAGVWTFTRVLNTSSVCWKVRFDPGDATTAYAAMSSAGLYRLSFAADGTFLTATKILDRPAGGGGAINCVAVDRHGRVFAAAGDYTRATEFVNMSVNRGASWTNLKTDQPGTAQSLGVLETVTYPSGEEHLLIGTHGTGSYRRRLPDAGAVIAVKTGDTTLTHSQSALDFVAGNVTPGSSVTLTISNRGTSPLTNLSLSVTGACAAEFAVMQPSSAEVAAGGSTACSVTFSPVAQAPHAATLHIASNAAEQPSFDIGLTGQLPPLTNTCIAGDAAWRYFDRATDLGTAWRSNAFSDAAWSSGPAPLGFGDLNGFLPATVIASNRQWTAYFRRAFYVPDSSIFTSFNARMLRDDGAVVYLNGTEVWRDNMPAGAIAYATPASTSLSGTNESTWVTKTLSPANLVNGTNLLAAEVHQQSTSSPDLAFAFELTGSFTLPGLPKLDVSAGGPALTLTWPAVDPGVFSVFEATNLAPPVLWTRLTNTPSLLEGAWRVPLPARTEGSRFYLLRTP